MSPLERQTSVRMEAFSSGFRRVTKLVGDFAVCWSRKNKMKKMMMKIITMMKMIVINNGGNNNKIRKNSKDDYQ